MSAPIDNLKRKLDEMLSKGANDYKLEDFARIPDGYTVAPYCNEETTAIAYEVGFNAAVNALMPVIELLRKQRNELAQLVEDETRETSGWRIDTNIQDTELLKLM